MTTDRLCEACAHDWRGGPECPICGHVTPDENPREKGDDDGREYGDLRDAREEWL